MKKTMLALAAAAALVSSSAFAHQAGDVILRGGPIVVVPNTSTNNAAFKFDVNSSTQLGLTATYMVTDNLGVELLAATPFHHNISLPGSGTVVKTKQLPPSLYAQYYFLDKNAKARPYVGAGINYTQFFGTKSTVDSVKNVKLKHSWGPVVNAGVDIGLTDHLYLNASMWYAKIKTKATFKLGVAPQSVDVKLDPTVFFLGLGYRF